MKTTTKQTTIDSIGNALYAFGGLGLEIVWMMIETSLYGIETSAWSDMQQIFHWVVTSILWGVVGVWLLRKLPKTTSSITKRKMRAMIICMIISILFTSMMNGGCKPWMEYQRLGFMLWIVQYIYYAFESLLIVLIIAHSTCAFEKLQHNHPYTPFGGIALALSWGLIHILTQGMMTGFYTVMLSLLFGLVYLLLNKHLKISYLIITIMFMI